MEALQAAAWGAFGASSLLIGAWLAVHWRAPRATVGMVMGFGAGALLAAIAYELIPTGFGPDPWLFAAFGLGAAVFYQLDRAVTKRSSRGAGSAQRSIALGALLDGIPESMVLGMGVAQGGTVGVAFLAAVFLSNLPESLGATATMDTVGGGPRRPYRIWWIIIGLSALAAAVGYLAVTLLPQADGTYAEAFAAGAVLTMLTDSMMPEAYAQGGKATGLLTVLGFAVAGALSAMA
ncbi:ZIP family metal transporter [Catellatospora tritici]|uniref:ZIP family metal transporter n=1 Tax=Catellatospora tritici TaxID=2851566 RepID=UPI001C2CFCA9|nr:ZIP family zinc transporter [Catellatospora tritici]MBV1848902.1 ZIP family zinc transporter [Catellatospora tritici]